MLTNPDPPIHQAPVLFGTRRRLIRQCQPIGWSTLTALLNGGPSC
jgi:hypothetical protein